MEKEQASHPNPEIVTRLMTSVLDESAGTLKLYFTVSTGALVLFTNLLAGSHAPRPILAALAFSIFSFGASALFCLRLLLGVLKLRVMFVEAISVGESTQSMEGKIRVWSGEMKKYGKRMEWLFYIGVASAAVFVAAIVAVR